ncbi:cadherin-related tumor suppressor fat [Dermacentor variabilis]|uniref:cadherin-related tumor suppressor fat n=1 Tax=Dermacentor variabilis TaxID=34621 RepID=UPI003F5BB505
MASAERRPMPRRRWLMARRPLLFLPLLQLLAAVAPAACLTVNTEPSEALPAMRSRQADTRVLLELEEGQPAGTLVGYIPVRANFTYRFNEQPAEFTLDPESGAIRTAVEIDREQLASDRFDLVVLSSQPTYPIEVRLRVLDVNDNAPEFPESSLNVAFSESANVGTRVILDTASDGDAGANGLSTDYRIVGGNEDAKFRLVVTTNPSGETPFLHLETTGRLDREARDSYTLNVSARDGGTPPRLGHLQVNVTVVDVNDNPPMFDHSDYFVSINESLPAGASVLQVRATDADAGVNAQLSYFLDPAVQADFAIDADTGVLRTASTGPPRCKRSRPDAPRSCVFTVFAHDHGSPRQDGRAYVTVSLVDANDHEPVIRFRVFTAPDSYATVDENAQNGSVVAAVSVIDHDEGPNGDTVVEIRGGNELGHFRLEPTPSFDIVRVNGILDREKVSRYNLTVVATDRGSPPRSSTAFLLILVNDVNDHEPVFEQSEYSSQLSELAPAGSFVAAVTATDRDTGINARLSYAISSGNEKLWFRIDPATGLVTTARSIDREQQDLIELKISAKDGGPNPRWAHAILRVQLLDENDQAPAFALTSFKASIPENAEPGSLVTVLSAADGDLGSNGSVAYSLAPEVELMYPGMFHLDEVHGRLIAKQSLDRERQDAYSVIVVARDQGNPAQSSTATVELSVLDVDDHRPQFYPTQYFVELADGAPPGSFVSTVTATDQDDGNNARVAYSILAGAQGKFCIDATSGTLETTQELRLEHQARYEIQVAARHPNSHDSEGQDTALVVVFVREAGRAAPLRFRSPAEGYSFSIDEDGAQPSLGRELGRLSLERSDQVDRARFSIVDGDPQGWFRLDPLTGVLSTAAPLDRERSQRLTLGVVANTLSFFARTSVAVTLRDVNDNAPRFAQALVRLGVPESWPPGLELYVPDASDADDGVNAELEYALASGPAALFAVEHGSGMLRLLQPVRLQAGKEFALEMTVSDRGQPRLTSRQKLVVTVQDVNDHTPTFERPSYETSLLELTSVNERFFALHAWDADHGDNGRVSYQISEGNDEGRFGVFPDGTVYVKKALDREWRDLYALTVVARDHGEPPRSSAVSLLVHVLDENDNAPAFDNATFTFSLAENEPPDTHVGKLTAEDGDRGRNAELSFSLASNENDFVVDPRTGFVRSLRYFDREKLLALTGHDSITMDAVVLDSGITRLRGEAKVVVRITDVNDNAPVFSRPSYRASVSEAAAPGTTVARVSATDADEGRNGELLYAIAAGNEAGAFGIDEASGQLSLAAPLDREAAGAYTLLVIARDTGAELQHTATATVLVQVLDENDNAPEFALGALRADVPETTPIGYELHRFSATDRDLGLNGEVSFSIASGNVKEAFKVDSVTGALFLDRPLDFEQQGVYQLNVSASDGGSPRQAVSVGFTVRVLDVNDNPPQFANVAIVRQIEEGLPLHTPVVTVTAVDRDAGANGKLTYAITSQEPPGAHFSVRQDSGVVFTAAEIDREFSDTFRLTLTATDQGSPSLSSHKTVTIIVEDVNDNAPTFVSVDAGILPEDSEKGHVVMRLEAVDADANANGQVTYELVDGDKSLFAVDRTTGDLSLLRAVSRPAVSYSLAVQASDQAVPSQRKSSRVHLTVLGANKRSQPLPAFSAPHYSATVPENQPAGTSVLSVRAQGTPQGRVQYFLTSVRAAASGALAGRRFTVHRDSGLVTTAAPLDREAGSDVFQLELLAIDASAKVPRTAKASVTVTVLDRNDSPPRFQNGPYALSLSEDTPVGTTVAVLEARDPDLEGGVRFGIAGQLQDSSGRFEVDPLSGALVLAEPLDRELQAQHQFHVSATDGVQSQEALVTIEVLDTNDNLPLFGEAAYSFDLWEDTQRGAQVGAVSATDTDMGLNRQVSYSVLSDWANDVFSLNPQTGVFTLTSHLDYEQHQHYVLVVQAQDSGTPSLSSTATVYMNVMDLNDNAPLFDPMSYSDEVFENVTVGSSLLRVSATDLDSGDNGRIVYSIVEGDPDGHLAIEANGTIITRMPLDREKKSLYSLIVRATDQAIEVHRRLSSSVQVTIVLKDVNDMVPEFVTPNVTSVQENAPANSIVMAVKAVDSDEGRNSYVEYSLSPEHSFSLGPVDGLLRVKGPLDREQRASYELLVTARDRGHPVRSASQRLRVILLDENDNSPVFDPRQYSAAVSENASLGTSVLQVSATDQDEGASGQVRYSIIAGDPNHDFEVGQDTGVLRVRRALDYERRTRYLLTVQAEDCAGAGGTELRFDTATVTIAVTDVNDNAPAFVDSPYELHVVENAATPVVLLTLSAHDADHVPSGPLYYRLEESTQGLFRVNSSTGKLSLVQSLDREVKDRYQLTVLAVDSGSPRQTGTGTVNVLVSDINDNAPRFGRSRYIVTLPENQPVNTPLTTITATDADTGRNAQIRYSLRGENASQFRVEPDSGIITAQAPMDHEECERYVLQLVAEDHGLTQRHTAATEIIVLITDENDNRPVFSENNMTVVIPDTSDTGHFILGAQAQDMDSGANGRLIFHLSGPDAEKFQINQETGIVRLAKKLPAGQKKDVTYHFQIHATDQGKVPLSSSASVRASIASGNLFPKFQSGTMNRLTLSEGGIGSKGQVLTTISATSPKAGPAARINYHIVGGNNGGAFALNPTTGDLRVVHGEVLDLETMPRMQLWLAAGDSDDPMLSSATRIDIELTDVNDNVPEFEQDLYNTSVREEQLPGQLVAKLYARDPDSDKNGRVRYKLRPMTAKESTASLPFELNANTGELRTTARLDREQIASYQFLVEASDHGSPSLTGTATVVVTVTDKNDNPPRFTRLFSVNVTENAPIGSFVIQVTSSDRDAAENANATYSFTENPGERFAIDPYSGNVTVAGLLDRELHEEYLLKVAAVDGSWKAETPLTISLHDMNDNAPRFLQPVYRFRLAELQQAGAFIGHVSAMDADKAGPNAAVTYALRHPSDFFSLDPTSGGLLSKQPLRYRRSPRGMASPENQHILRIVATDHGKPPLSSEATIYINVVDANNHMPKFDKAAYFSPLPYNAVVGLSVLQVTARDEQDVGINAELVYSITDGNGTGLLDVHPSSGWLTVAKPLPRYQGQKFVLKVKATDQGVPPKTADAVVSIVITAENQFNPVFSALSYQIIIPENEPVGSELLTVSATDADSGLNGLVRYSIQSGNVNDSFIMDPHTGAMAIRRVLDYESTPEFRLNVSACDSAFNVKCAWATLTVIVTDVNDCAPEFNASIFDAYVPENELSGTVVTQLIATDADSGRNKLIQYALVGSSDFAIDSQTGLVTTKTTFDYEQASEYVLEVVASNPGSLQYSSCQLRVHITGKNEFYPRFVQPVFQFAVSESTVVGTAVGRVLATDEDSGPDGHVYFLFVGSSNDRGFRIQPSTGIITVARVLDREAQARVVLSVMAKNAGSIRGNDTDEAQVVVSIQDGNDPPMFLQPLYEARLSEAAPVGSSVLTVSAVDRDVRPNNHQFFYSIVDGDPNKSFSVDAQTGLLQTSMPLDREAVPVYSLTVAAIDHGSPPQTGTTVVRVTLDDVNDNGPELEPADLLGYVLEDEPPYTSVITLSARDPDLAPNGAPFTYSLVGGARKSLFELDRDTGLLRTTQRLDREATPSIQLLVEVQDSGTPPMRARHTLTIMLVDKNDSPSAPRLVTVMVWVYQNLFPGGKIADVRPLDPDTTGEYQCRLQGRDAIFSIVSYCDLHASRLLSPSNYSLTVRGNDGYHQDVTSTVNVQFKAFDNATVENSISLNIVNQSAHDFLSSTYDRFLGLLGHVLEGLGTPVIYSMTDVQGQLQLALAVKRSSGALVTPEKVVRRLEARKDSLQGMLTKTILVGYEPCVSSPCQHGGTCHSYLDLQPSLLILDSPQLVFVSPRASRSFACSCPSGFSGDQCQDQLDPCSPNPCADGAPCQPDIEAGFRCTCPPDRQGPRCKSPRQESCASSPCKNGGSCREAPGGSFFCLCRLGFKGSLCEQAADGCRPSRCRNGGTCISDGPAGYHCQCEPNYFGKHCEKSTYGFQPYSYMAFPSLKPSTNDISIVFSTNQRDALLAYNFGVQNGGRSDFVALEIVDGKAQFSFGGSRTAISKVSVDKEVADGGWHRVTVIRNGRVASLSVVSCQDHGEFCEECSHANSSCSLSVTGQAGTLSLSSQPLFVGGLPSVEPLLERPSQVAADDFVGCMHSVSVDGHPLALDAPLRAQYTTVACGRRGDPCAGGCKGGAPCHDLWFTSRCTCSGGGLLAHDCNEALEPYSLGSGSYLELVPQEKHRRAALLLQQSRRSVRSTASFKTMAFRLRTRTDVGLLLQVATERDYTRLQLVDGHLEYISQTKQQDPVRWRHPRRISDGNWQDITLSRKLESGGAVMLAVGDAEHQIPSDGSLHDFLDPFLSSFTIGGHWDLNSVTHENSPGSFQGCIQQIAVNGELQSLNASHNYFQLVVRGTVGRSCNQEALGLDVAADPLGVGIILVIAFFVVLILVILVSLLVFRRCKLKRPKAATSNTQAKSNGCSVINQLTDATRASAHQEPNYTEPAMPSAPEEHPRSTPSAPELVPPKKTREREGSADLQQVRAPQRPDIIEREVLHASSPLAGPRCPEQPAYSSAEPEHYDLENASSIAPSDIDVVYHYRVFRDGSQLRKLHKGVHKHPGTHRHSPASPKARHSPRQQLLLRPAARDSPSALKMHSTPLARLSPSSELSRQTPRILTLQDISGKPLQTALLASAHPGGGSKPFKDPLTNSERSLNSPVSQLSRSTGSLPSAKLKQACAPAAESHCSQPLSGLGLTAEEIECLNARPRNSSLVSTLDAVSSSGSEGTKAKLSQLLEDRPTTTTLLDAAAVHDSSSDESGNDSFTCSEFEYDNGYDKAHHRDFGPGNMIFSKLAEEDNENDEDPSKTYDGFDSFRGSLSTLVASDDDLSHLSYKPPSGAVLGWDCLLNWGPNFENLVGVFKDIADLPDTVSPLTPGHPKPNEEYV